MGLRFKTFFLMSTRDKQKINATAKVSVSRKTNPIHVSRSLGKSGYVDVRERLLYPQIRGSEI
jgi:hypothetical protein